MAVQVRKTVTVLFADVVGSTALTETTDPETVRAALGRYFDAMREVLEQHGGTVEKFVGDAVMAVFGVPTVHEDDALRAVRAAARMRERSAALDLHVPLELRIGVTTGEVVAGDGETFATGDAVNVAARLETAAAPGEILLGDETYRLVAAAVRAEPHEPLELKGKSERVPAYRLLEVLPDAPAFTRRLDAPFVGREHELGTLLGELARAQEDRTCRFAVVTGDAGIGKSRLVRELVHAAGQTRVLVGRCVSYGDGITYWPLREIVQQVGGAEPRPELGRLLGDQAAEAILGAVGLAPVSAQGSEIHWAARRLLEETAPVIVVLDDLHWAEPTFLDLIDYVRAFARNASILLVATGRPDLLDARPTWRDAAIELAPLDVGDATRLVEALGASLPHAVRARAVDAAEGNPLFVEQLIAMAEDSSEAVVVPPTIHALLASRIDGLPDDERAVVQCAAVEGRLFHRSAVEALAQDALRPAVIGHLLALVRRRLIRPGESLFPGDDGFRFAHALVREAAYRAATKASRASAHERYAAWLRDAAPAADDLDEILAYHLEQAALLGTEVGTPRPDLAAEAGSLLASAGRRAISRGDVGAAAGLLDRAASLLPASAERVTVLAARAYVAISRGEFPTALRAVEEAVTAPEADDAGRARARLIGRWIEVLSSARTVEETRSLLEADIATLRAAGDDWWTARGLVVLANTCAMEARFGPAVPMLLPIFQLEGAMADPALRAELLFWVGAALTFGPVPVAEARAEIEALARYARTPLEEAWRRFPLGLLAACEGRFDEARVLFAESRESMRDAGAELYYAANGMFVGWMELMAGRPEVALAIERESWDLLGAAGEQGLRSSVGLHLATTLCALGRLDEAEETAAQAIALTADHDATAQFHHRGLLSRLRSQAGRHEEALRLARESVAIAATTDSAWHQVDAHMFLADAASAAGHDDERRAAARDALRLIDSHGLTVYRGQAQALAS